MALVLCQFQLPEHVAYTELSHEYLFLALHAYLFELCWNAWFCFYPPLQYDLPTQDDVDELVYVCCSVEVALGAYDYLFRRIEESTDVLGLLPIGEEGNRVNELQLRLDYLIILLAHHLLE